MDPLTLDLSERNIIDASSTALTVTPSPDKSPSPDSEDFDWSATDAVVLTEQPETACYFNDAGSLLIRQHRWPDEDTLIFISASNVDTFLDKLTDICGIPSIGGRDE